MHERCIVARYSNTSSFLPSDSSITLFISVARPRGCSYVAERAVTNSARSPKSDTFSRVKNRINALPLGSSSGSPTPVVSNDSLSLLLFLRFNLPVRKDELRDIMIFLGLFIDSFLPFFFLQTVSRSLRTYPLLLLELYYSKRHVEITQDRIHTSSFLPSFLSSSRGREGEYRREFDNGGGGGGGGGRGRARGVRDIGNATLP